MDIPDGKPKWNGLNDASDLIEDSPPELKKRKREEDEKARRTRRRSRKMAKAIRNRASSDFEGGPMMLDNTIARYLP